MGTRAINPVTSLRGSQENQFTNIKLCYKLECSEWGRDVTNSKTVNSKKQGKEIPNENEPILKKYQYGKETVTIAEQM